MYSVHGARKPDFTICIYAIVCMCVCVCVHSNGSVRNNGQHSDIVRPNEVWVRHLAEHYFMFVSHTHTVMILSHLY